MNLLKINNQILVANNWHIYKDKISIPQELRNNIKIVVHNYDEGLLTLFESGNQILSEFIKC